MPGAGPSEPLAAPSSHQTADLRSSREDLFTYSRVVDDNIVTAKYTAVVVQFAHET